MKSLKDEIKKNQRGFFIDKVYKQHRIYKSGFEFKKDAIDYLKKEIERVDYEIYLKGCIDDKRISMEQLFEEYVKHSNISEKTIRNKRQMFEKYILIDRKDISKLRDSDIVEIFNQIIERCHNVTSKKQANAIMSFFNKLIFFGKDKNFLKNDISTHEEYYYKKTSKEVSERTKRNYLMADDFNTLVESIDFFKQNSNLFPSKSMDPEDFELFLYILGHIGLRIGEMRAIVFEDIIVERNGEQNIYKIKIDKQFSDEATEVYEWTKTGEKRTAIIPNFLIDKINKHQDKHGFKDDDFIFNTKFNNKKNKGRSILAKTFRELLKKSIKILKKNNALPEYFNHDISCNALRRTAEDFLTTIDAVDAKTASEVMGHSEKVAFIHYKKVQKISESIIANRSQSYVDNVDKSYKETVITCDSKVKKEDRIEVLQSILKDVLFEHVTGAISQNEYEEIRKMVMLSLPEEKKENK